MPTSNFQPVRLLDPGYWYKPTYLIQTVQIQTICLMRKLTDLNLHCLQRHCAYSGSVGPELRQIGNISNFHLHASHYRDLLLIFKLWWHFVNLLTSNSVWTSPIIHSNFVFQKLNISCFDFRHTAWLIFIVKGSNSNWFGNCQFNMLLIKHVMIKI